MTAALLVLALGQFIGPNGGVDSMPLRSRPSFSFVAPAAGDYATLTAATGQTVSCARSTTITVRASPGATPTSVAANHCAVDYRGLQVEGIRTNFLLNSGAPATQTTASLSTGTYNGWMDGTGSVAFTVGTATATGLACTASSGVSCTFTVTVAGTVVATVTGSPTREQLENNTGPGSYIPTTGTVVSTGADVVSIGKPAGVTFASSDYSIAVTAQREGGTSAPSATSNCTLGSNASFMPIMQLSRAANTITSYSDTPATFSNLTYADSLKTSSTRYQMHVVSGTSFACAAGTCNAGVALGAQPADPTLIYFGQQAGTGTNSLNGWISSFAICKGNPGGACAP